MGLEAMSVICPNHYAEELSTVALPWLARRIVESLSAGRGQPVKVEHLVEEAYSDRDDGGPLAARCAIYTTIRRINKAISPHGWTIQNDFWRGYRLVRTANAT